MVMINSVNGDRVLEAVLLAELGPREQAIYDQVSEVEGGFPLLDFLVENPNTLATSDILALKIGEDAENVERALEMMESIGLVRRLEIGPILWGLASSSEDLEPMTNLVAWQNRWRVRLADLDRVISGAVCYGK